MRAIFFTSLFVIGAWAFGAATPISSGGSGAVSKQLFISTGTNTAGIYAVTSANATVGATYTNNGITYTVLQTISSGSTLYMSGIGTLSCCTLTKATGTGDATITYSTFTGMATYTPRGTAKSIKITVVGGGGGGGGTASAASAAGAGGGGGGGGTAIKLITSPGTVYYYAVGTGGAGGTAGANAGSSGTASVFISNAITPLIGNPGTGGAGSSTSSTPQYPSGSGGGGLGTGGDTNIPGGSGFGGLILAAAQANGGFGGGSFMAGISDKPNLNQTHAGDAGKLYGGGGSGAQELNGGGAQAGGAGATGVVLVEEF